MPSSVSIRDLQESDISGILRLAKKAHRESSYAALDFDAGKVTMMMATWLANPDTHFCQLATDGPAIFAMYVGYLSQYYFGNDWVATDCLLYVEESKRGGVAAIALIRAFDAWAFDHGAAEVRPASSTGIKLLATQRLYEALGYTTVGHTFVKRR